METPSYNYRLIVIPNSPLEEEQCEYVESIKQDGRKKRYFSYLTDKEYDDLTNMHNLDDLVCPHTGLLGKLDTEFTNENS